MTKKKKTGHDDSADLRKRAEEALAQQNDALSKLNHFSIELSMLSPEDNLEVFITKRIKEFTGAVAATFSEYNPENRTLTPKHIELEPGLLEKVVNLLGKQVNKIHAVVSDEMYREMTKESIGMRRTLYEASFGAISHPVEATIQALLKADRFIGLAYLIEGKLYGSSLLAMSKDQPDLPKEILENFLFLATASLRRKHSEEALRESEVRFRELFKRMSSGVAVYEAIDNGGDFIFRDFNPAAEKIEKVSRKDILGKRVSEAFPGVKAFGVFEVFQRVWQTGKPEYFPENIYKDEKDPGSWRESWVFKLPTGEIVAIYNDITERKRAEDKLLDTQLLLSAVIESTNDFIWSVDPERFGLLTFNKRLRDNFLDTRGIHIKTGMTPEDLYPRPDFVEEWNDLYRRALLEGSYKTEYVGKTRSQIMELNFKTLKRDGAVIGISVFGKDITERKRAEEEIQSLAKFPAENPAPILRIARDGTLLYINQAGLNLLPEWHLQVGKATPLMLREVALQVLDNGSTRRLDLEHRRQIYSFSVVPVVDAGYANLYARDVTERRKAEEALRESKEFAENLISSMLDGFSVLDSDGVQIDVNAAFCQMTGFSREELIGVGLPHPYWPPEAYEEIEKGFQKTLRGEFSDVELTFMRKNGERFPVIVSPSWVKDKQGNVISYFASVKDITERKRAEEEKRRLEERSRKVVEDIFRFIPEGVLVFSRKMELLRQNQAFRELVSGYAQRLGFAEDELENLIIDKIKAGMGDKIIKEIRISRKHETGK